MRIVFCFMQRPKLFLFLLYVKIHPVCFCARSPHRSRCRCILKFQNNGFIKTLTIKTSSIRHPLKYFWSCRVECWSRSVELVGLYVEYKRFLRIPKIGGLSAGNIQLFYRIQMAKEFSVHWSKTSSPWIIISTTPDAPPSSLLSDSNCAVLMVLS